LFFSQNDRKNIRKRDRVTYSAIVVVEVLDSSAALHGLEVKISVLYYLMSLRKSFCYEVVISENSVVVVVFAKSDDMECI
jgi:hypothetical protein